MSSKKGKFHPAGVGMTPSRTELGSFIRARRLELDLRQIPLAKRVGLAQLFVSEIEIGTRKYLNDRQLEQFAKALQCDVEELRKRMPVKPGSQPKTELGKLIRSRREELGLTFKDFAEKMRMTFQKAKHLETRKNPNLGYNLVKPLASALNLDPSVFVQFVGRMQKQTKSELGQLVRMRRKELGMSISALAEKLDVSKQYVNRIEFGRCPLSENNDMIERLTQILELDVNELEAVRPARRLKQLKQMDNTNPLGGFLAARRLELRLTQREVGERAEIWRGTVSGVETGRLRPSPNLLDKLAKALDCQVPSELIPPPWDRDNSHKAPRFRKQDAPASLVMVHLSGQSLPDLEKIKGLSDIRTNTESARKALKLLRLLLEKQRDGYVVFLRKDEDVVKLELIL